MSSSQDWSALASQNERVVTDTAIRQAPQPHRSARTSRVNPQVRGRLRLRKRPGRTGTAARA
jgi:hypothetical protein